MGEPPCAREHLFTDHRLLDGEAGKLDRETCEMSLAASRGKR